MYFPAGMWHSVETLEPGISLNVSLMGTSYAELYCSALQHVLMKDRAWRSIVVDDLENIGSRARDELSKLISQSGLGDIPHFKLTADMILPPVQCERLRIATFEGENEEVWGDIDEDGSTDASEDAEDVIADEEEEEEEEEGGEGTENDLYSLDAPCEHTTTATTPTKPDKVKLAKNPLCLVMKEEDVTMFYSFMNKEQKNPPKGTKRKRNDDEKEEHENGTTRWIMNLNFAGNEMHASAVRRILTTSSEDKAKTLNDVIAGDLSNLRKNPDLLDHLIYLGVIVSL